MLSNCIVTPWTVASRLLCPWDFPGKNIGVACHFLLQGIFPDQRIEPMSPELSGEFFATKPPGKSIMCAILVCRKFRCIRSHIHGNPSNGIFTIDRVLPWSFIFDTKFLLKRYAKYLLHLIKAFSVVLASKDSTIESDQCNYGLSPVWLKACPFDKIIFKFMQFQVKMFFVAVFVLSGMNSHYILCRLPIKSMTCPNKWRMFTCL